MEIQGGNQRWSRAGTSIEYFVDEMYASRWSWFWIDERKCDRNVYRVKVMENEKLSEEGRTVERQGKPKNQSDRKTKMAKDKANKNNEKKQREELLHPAMDDPSCKRYW